MCLSTRSLSWSRDGKIKPLEELNQIVLKLHPGATITDSDLDNHFNGYEYEVELRDAKNVEWDVDFERRHRRSPEE